MLCILKTSRTADLLLPCFRRRGRLIQVEQKTCDTLRKQNSKHSEHILLNKTGNTLDSMRFDSILLLNLGYTKIFELSVYGAFTNPQGISCLFTVTVVLVK